MARSWIRGCILFALLLGPNVTEAQEGWLELRSENYRFVGDVDDEDLFDVAHFIRLSQRYLVVVNIRT